MQITAARLAIVGLVLGACFAHSEARGGHGLQDTVHDGRGVPNRKNFGYYGPKWRRWPGDQSAGPELATDRPRGEGAPQLPPVDVPAPAEEVRRANPIQAGPQQSDEPAADPVPSTVLPATPAPGDGAEPPVPAQPAPRRQPGARDGGGIFREPEHADGADDATQGLSTAAIESAIQETAAEEPLLRESAPTLEPGEPAPAAELEGAVDLEQIFANEPAPSAEATTPQPAVLGPSQVGATLAVASSPVATGDEIVRSRYRAGRTNSPGGKRPAGSASATADNAMANMDAASPPNSVAAARQRQVEYARPGQKSPQGRTSVPPQPDATSGNPLRGGIDWPPTRLESVGNGAAQAELRVEAEPPTLSPENPMRGTAAPPAGANPLRR